MGVLTSSPYFPIEGTNASYIHRAQKAHLIKRKVSSTKLIKTAKSNHFEHFLRIVKREQIQERRLIISCKEASKDFFQNIFLKRNPQGHYHHIKKVERRNPATSTSENSQNW